MIECSPYKFHVDCPSRKLFEQISDKWSMMILTVLDDGPLRFNEIRRQLEGITQKAQTQTLRRLERNGLVERKVIASSPVAVQYEITPLGRKLQGPFKALYKWTLDYMPEVEKARATYDARIEQVENV
ncbi:winged helix-turn-helix transcriptional regulator [Thalassospira mesophila]|uniref:MarR family transcriptional regulator n=1 Tax=Thalassospira mesophila TaxID=1293891 RepID=A0A1Y2L2U2_9PROT|nr:helix-turn-helix domain-containing protein [Thalassospira mesophila]OSQ39808.1 MarR family transcriptional regulator [Thalassospira mesophila]